MADEPSDEKAADAPNADAQRVAGEHPYDPRNYQRNLAERLFPGPSRQMSPKVAQRIEGLLQPLDEETRAKLRSQRENWRAANERGSRAGQVAPGASGAPGRARAVNAATTEDIAQVRESLDEQNELLRAILASSVDTQTDARATAQNSRTFAWAGTAIALLTLVATVLSIIAATGH